MHSSFIADLAKFLFSGPFHWECRNYLELGVQAGNTFNKVAPYAELAVGVDTGNCFPHISHNPNAKFFQMTTDEFLQSVLPKENMRFGLVFIDAWHEYEQVLRDFFGVVPFVTENGIICLHDTYPPSEAYLNPSNCNDAYRAAWYIRTEYRDAFEIVTLTQAHGISIIRKATKQLAWL